MEWDWSQYATGGAQRPDSFSGMAPEFNAALQRMFAEAPPEIQQQLRVGSGYRSTERQEQLWQEALAKYGSPEAARKWVAPPGRSQHNHGNAADLKYLSPDAKAWAHANAAQYGLAFPLDNEDWHVELASARGGAPAPQAAPQGVVTGTNQLAAMPQAAPQAVPNQLAEVQWQPQITQIDPRAFMTRRNQLQPVSLDQFRV